MRRTLALMLCASLPWTLLACGDDDDTTPATTATGTGGHAGHGGHQHSVDEHACEHLNDGPFEDVTASAIRTTAPDVSTEHTAFRVTLVDLGAGGSGAGGSGVGGSGAGGAPSGGTLGGYLTFAAADALHYVFFLDEDVPFGVVDSNGSPVSILDSCDPAACSADCAAAQGRHEVELGVGTYYLQLGPTELGQVTLVREEESHEH